MSTRGRFLTRCFCDGIDDTVERASGCGHPGERVVTLRTTTQHDVGDAVLREVAYEVRKRLRKFELVYRVGGEEFLVVLPGMGEGQGELTAEHLRAAIECARSTAGIRVTASFGVSGGSGEAIEFEALYRSADQALYDAKRGGRDRVSVSNRLATA
jgi:diguanylate cyclase (GGDEF)-like protein